MPVHTQASRRLLAQDMRGATIVEFAFVAPVLVLMLMFMFDTGYFLYARSILGGEMQAAGRSSSLETATIDNQDSLDTRVRSAVLHLVHNGHVDFSRTAYKSYGRAQSKAESFIDGDGDNICNHGEAFDDANGNGKRDLDSGMTGQGGAKDVTVYTATLEYDRLFPITSMLGGSNRVSMSDSTILRNQPYDKQPEPKVDHCP